VAQTKYRTKTNKETKEPKGAKQNRVAAKQNNELRSSEDSLRRSEDNLRRNFEDEI
jgi:hypothetical protein